MNGIPHTMFIMKWGLYLSKPYIYSPTGWLSLLAIQLSNTKDCFDWCWFYGSILPLCWGNFFPQTLLTAVWALTLQFSRQDSDFSWKTCCLFILSLTLKYVLKWTLDFWGCITQMSARLQAVLACFNCVCSQQEKKQNKTAQYIFLTSVEWLRRDAFSSQLLSDHLGWKKDLPGTDGVFALTDGHWMGLS